MLPKPNVYSHCHHFSKFDWFLPKIDPFFVISRGVVMVESFICAAVVLLSVNTRAVKIFLYLVTIFFQRNFTLKNEIGSVTCFSLKSQYCRPPTCPYLPCVRRSWCCSRKSKRVMRRLLVPKNNVILVRNPVLGLSLTEKWSFRIGLFLKSRGTLRQMPS